MEPLLLLLLALIYTLILVGMVTLAVQLYKENAMYQRALKRGGGGGSSWIVSIPCPQMADNYLTPSEVKWRKLGFTRINAKA